MQIGNTSEVAFADIVTATEHVVDLWSKWQACQTCPARVPEQFLHIYSKLADFLEGAIITYTSSPQRLPDVHSSTTTTLDWQAWLRSSSQQNCRQGGTNMSGNLISPLVPSVVCLPSAMSLGEYELTEQQSRHLALELVGRKLKSLSAILRQMLDQEDEVGERRSRTDATLSHVLMLLSTVHRQLLLLQVRSVRKTGDISPSDVDTDDYNDY